MAEQKMTEQKMALTVLNEKQVAVILSGVDTTGMTAEDKQQLAVLLQQDMEQSNTGFDFRPQRYKVNKDNQTFTDPLGVNHDDLKGVVLYKQKVRALWQEGENAPLCSSLDCVLGKDHDGVMRRCHGCPNDEWGSAGDEKEARSGKACKEMRRIYLVEKDAPLPILVTLPPTSIRPWDDYNSARLTRGISDMKQETILRLAPAKTSSFNYSVAQPKIGPVVSPPEMVRLFQMRQKFIAGWQSAEVGADDYGAEDNSGAGAPVDCGTGAGAGEETIPF